MMEVIEEDPAGVGGNRRRDGDIGGSAGLAKVERLDLRDPAAGNEDKIELIEDNYVRLGGS
jgi:hypothetical protein